MADTYFTTKTWADIDSMNQQHYRKHPLAITYADAALDKAFHLHIVTTDAEPMDAEMAHEALAAYLLVSKYYARVWDKYMADALTEQRYDLLRDELADRDDDPRADLQAVQ